MFNQCEVWQLYKGIHKASTWSFIKFSAPNYENFKLWVVICGQVWVFDVYLFILYIRFFFLQLPIFQVYFTVIFPDGQIYHSSRIIFFIIGKAFESNIFSFPERSSTLYTNTSFICAWMVKTKIMVLLCCRLHSVSFLEAFKRNPR